MGSGGILPRDTQRDRPRLAAMSPSGNRPLTEKEDRLVRWMLEHGDPMAHSFLPQVDPAEVTPWRCPCGCPSVNFEIKGYSVPPPGMNVIAEFAFGGAIDPHGILVFERGGVLSGLEVYSMLGETRPLLPDPSELRPLK